MILFFPSLFNGFFIPYVHAQAILTTDLPGVSEMTYTNDTVLPSEKGDEGAGDAWVLPALQLSLPWKLESLTGERPPWPD